MNNSKPKVLLDMSKIIKEYTMGEETIRVLKEIDLKIYEGEFVAILGPSGSGKSTLMNIIGCLDVCTSGKVVLNEREIENLSEKELSRIRNKEIGFVFQQFQLLQKINAIKNVELPLIYAGVSDKNRRERAEKLLNKVGLSEKMFNRPNQLSGGQQQRVAIARALVTNPSILLADEPTGALDQKTGVQIMNLFKDLHSEGKTIIMITHDEKIARNASRIVRITDGELFETDDKNFDEIEIVSSIQEKNQNLILGNVMELKAHTQNKLNDVLKTLNLDNKSFIISSEKNENGENISKITEIIKYNSQGKNGEDIC